MWLIFKESCLLIKCLLNLCYYIKFYVINILYTRYPIVARALGRVHARGKVSCIQINIMLLLYYYLCHYIRVRVEIESGGMSSVISPLMRCRNRQ